MEGRLEDRIAEEEVEEMAVVVVVMEAAEAEAVMEAAVNANERNVLMSL
jgi:hypothetical protein